MPSWKDALNKVRRNAVVIFPALVAAADAALTQPKWQDAVYVAVGVLLRQFFTSPTFEVQERSEGAWVDGWIEGTKPPQPPAAG